MNNNHNVTDEQAQLLGELSEYLLELSNDIKEAAKTRKPRFWMLNDGPKNLLQRTSNLLNFGIDSDGTDVGNFLDDKDDHIVRDYKECEG